MQQPPASLKKHLELLKPSGAPWNTQLGLAQNPRLPSSTGRAMPGAQGTQLWHLRAEQGLGHRLPSPSQGQRGAGSGVLGLAQGAKGWSLINFCTQPDPSLAGSPCTATGRRNVQPAGSSPCLWNSHHSSTEFQASSFVSAPQVRSFTASATVRCSSAAQFTVSEQFKTLTTSPKQ